MTLIQFDARFQHDHAADQPDLDGFGSVYTTWNTPQMAQPAIKKIQVKDHNLTLQRGEADLPNQLRMAHIPAKTPQLVVESINATPATKSNWFLSVATFVMILIGGGWGFTSTTAAHRTHAEGDHQYPDSIADREHFVQDSLENDRMLAGKEQRSQDSLQQVPALAEREQQRQDSLEPITEANVQLALMNASGLSTRITAIEYKLLVRTGGTWGRWSEQWKSYASEGRTNPSIRITEVISGSAGHVYRLQLVIDGSETASFLVVYDPQKTREIRDQWGDRYVNCYKADNGDYVFTQKVSLESLVKDNSAWSSDENALLYFMFYSQGLCIVLR